LQEQAPTDTTSQYGRKIAWLVLPTWIALSLELLGGWRFGMDTYSGKYAVRVGPFYSALVGFVLAIVVVSPLLIVEGFRTVLSHRAILQARKWLFPKLTLVLAVSLLASMASCIWSCGGHPTWTNGYK